MEDQRDVRVTERQAIPPLSLFLGFGAMVPIAAGAAVAWLSPEPGRRAARDATLLWSGSILAFLAGVRRGLSFRTPGGARPSQIGTTLWLFTLGFGSLPLLRQTAAPVLQAVGFLSIAALDPGAATRNEAPLFFRRLRPVQMTIPVLSLLSVALLPESANPNADRDDF